MGIENFDIKTLHHIAIKLKKIGNNYYWFSVFNRRNEFNDDSVGSRIYLLPVCWKHRKSHPNGSFLGSCKCKAELSVGRYAACRQTLQANLLQYVARGCSWRQYEARFTLRFSIGGRRIDFLDIKNSTIYELKPYNPRAIQQGHKQLNMYMRELETTPQFRGIN